MLSGLVRVFDATLCRDGLFPTDYLTDHVFLFLGSQNDDENGGVLKCVCYIEVSDYLYSFVSSL